MLQASKFNRIEALRYGLAGPTSTPNPDASTRAGGGGQFVTGGGGQLVTGGGGQLIIGSAASVGGGRPIPGSPAFIGLRGRAKPVRKVKSFPHALSFLEALVLVLIHFPSKGSY